MAAFWIDILVYELALTTEIKPPGGFVLRPERTPTIGALRWAPATDEAGAFPLFMLPGAGLQVD
jgi:hypothetical protein